MENTDSNHFENYGKHSEVENLWKLKVIHIILSAAFHL